MDPSAVRVVRLRDVAVIGLNRGNLRRAGWSRLSQGMHVYAPAALSVEQTARALVGVLPRDSGFGHLTSAELRGWWLPHRLPPHVDFATTTSRVHVQRRGLYVRRSHYASFEMLDGLPVSTSAETLIELARDLPLVDLVPMVDQAIATGTAPAAILAAARPGARGARTLRRAVALADPRSESWWESVLRLQHTVTGLGPVMSQVDVHDGRVLVARADLHLVGTSRYPECDGGEHRTVARHAHDLARDKALGRLGLERFGYPTAEIARRPEMVIRDAEDARRVAHDPRRLRVWWQVARGSSLTGHGRTLLAGRLARYRQAAEHPVASSGRVPGRTGGQTSPLDAA